MKNSRERYLELMETLCDDIGFEALSPPDHEKTIRMKAARDISVEYVTEKKAGTDLLSFNTHLA